MTLLELRQLRKEFGGVVALNNLDLEVKAGTIHSIIGPNGAGKTTLFNLITGMVPSTSGEIRFDGRLVAGLRPDQVAALGIARTFQNIRLFNTLTVLENVKIGRHVHDKAGLTAAILRPKWVQQEEAETEAECYRILDMLGIADKSREIVSNLPYGDQRRVEIARALAGNPKLLLLDEPTVGMSSEESAVLVDLIKQLQNQNFTVILIAHDMPVVMRISDIITVINFGQKIAEGTAEAVSENEQVLEAYLGTPDMWEEDLPPPNGSASN